MLIANLLLLLTLLSIGKGCRSTVETRYCSFSVNSTSEGCTSLSFNYCLRDLCYECEQLQTKKYLTWKQCMNNCCENSVGAPQTYETLRNCQTKSGGYLRVVFILAVVFVSLVALTLMFIACTLFFRNRHQVGRIHN